MPSYERPRLTAALRDSATRGIAVLIAPAGFGKSQAIADAFGSSAYYVQLADDAPTVEGLAREIISASSPNLLRNLNALLSKNATPDSTAHLTTWTATSLQTTPCTIVIDDLQRLGTEKATYDFLRDLIASTIPAVKWVLASRDVLPLPLALWSARDYMTMAIDTGDLAFSLDEAVGLAQAMQLDIDANTLATLVDDVGGWPLALRLAITTWNRERTLPNLRSRARGLLFDFLDQEIWQPLPDNDRRICEVAANLVTLRPAILTKYGVTNAHQSLDRLHQQLPLLTKLQSGSYRLHDLFRDFVIDRLQQTPEHQQLLVQQLARILADLGSIDEAIGLAVQAEDWTLALAILEAHGIDRIDNGRRAEITALLSRFPRHMRDHQVVCGLRGYMLSLAGQYRVAVDELRNALQRPLADAFANQIRLRLAGSLVNLQLLAEADVEFESIIASANVEDDIKIEAYAQQSRALASMGESARARAAALAAIKLEAHCSLETRARVSYNLCVTYRIMQDITLSAEYAQKTVSIAETLNLDNLRGLAYSALIVVADIAADIKTEIAYGDKALVYIDAANLTHLRGFVLNTLLVGSAIIGDAARVATLYPQYREWSHQISAQGNAMMQAYLAMLRFITRDDDHELIISELTATYNSIDDTLTAPNLWGRALIASILVLMLAKHEPARARQWFARMPSVQTMNDRILGIFVYGNLPWIRLAHWVLGERADTLSLNASEASLLYRELNATVDLICSRSQRSQSLSDIQSATANLRERQHAHLFATFIEMVATPNAPAILTKAERDALQLVANGLRTSDIAHELGKSENTILSQIKSAGKKLKRSGREATVAHARELHLIT